MDELRVVLCYKSTPNAARTLRPIKDLEVDCKGNSYEKLNSKYPLLVACRINAPMSVILAFFDVVLNICRNGLGAPEIVLFSTLLQEAKSIAFWPHHQPSSWYSVS